MKKIFLLFTLLSILSINAQSLEVGAGLGTGYFYFGEEVDNAAQTSFKNHRSLYFDLAYRIPESANAFKLRFQQTAVDVVGKEYRTQRPLDGSVETFTTAIVYERLNFNKRVNLGYQLGMGFTQEDLVVNTALNTVPERDRFTSVLIGAVASTDLSYRLRLNVELTGLWTDPLNTIRSSDQWQTAGEDISFILQAGLSFRLF